MTKQIALVQGMFALVDDENYDEINKYTWYYHRDKNCEYAQRHITIESQKITTTSMHIEIMCIHTDRPKGKEIDHVDGNGLNNQKSNLRWATKSQNQANRILISKNNNSNYKGVHWATQRQKWRASIQSKGKIINIGYFDCPIEAAKAYDHYAKRLFNEFAKLNFPNITSP